MMEMNFVLIAKKQMKVIHVQEAICLLLQPALLSVEMDF